MTNHPLIIYIFSKKHLKSLITLIDCLLSTLMTHSFKVKKKTFSTSAVIEKCISNTMRAKFLLCTKWSQNRLFVFLFVCLFLSFNPFRFVPLIITRPRNFIWMSTPNLSMTWKIYSGDVHAANRETTSLKFAARIWFKFFRFWDKIIFQWPANHVSGKKRAVKLSFTRIYH